MVYKRSSAGIAASGVELPRLGQVGLLSEVGHLKQRRTAFDRTGDEVWRLVLDKIEVAEVPVDRSKYRGADLEHGGHPRGCGGRDDG